MTANILYLIMGIFIITVFILYTYITRQSDKEDFDTDSHIYFMGYEETERFLFEDKDAYVQSFSPYDLHARKVNSKQEYIEQSAKLASSFTSDEKKILQKCAVMADEFFRTVNFVDTEYYNDIDGKALANIKWVFALTTKTDGKEYEEGFPHTRENIIFISKKVLSYNESDLTNTLIHEKVHVYQRYNPLLFKRILNSMNYGLLDMNNIPTKHLIRANPDLDGNIYYDKNTNKEVICMYKSELPTGINDVHYSNFISEHPYEKIAYDIAGIFYKIHIDKYKDI